VSHLSQPVLQRFVHGDLGDELAVACALHLDDCPECATRWALHEPLSLAFAACEDPEVPDDLAEAILAELRLPASWVDEAPVLELLLSAGFLTAAAVILFAFGAPLDLFTDAAVATAGLFRAMTLLLQQALALSAWWMPPLALGGLVASVVLATNFGKRRLPW
jgi:hypothetical protein